MAGKKTVDSIRAKYAAGGDIDPSDMDPQSAVAAQGFGKLAEAAYESEPVQNIVTGKGLENSDAILRKATQGNPEAQAQLASSSLGVAAGSIQGVGAKGLAMDEASRMARAKEAGFDTSKVYYHGTRADIEAFDPSALGASTKAASARQGYFFATDPSTASDYANLAPSRSELRGKIKSAAIEPELNAIHDKLVEKYGEKYITPEKFDAQMNDIKAFMSPEEFKDLYAKNAARVVDKKDPLLQKWNDVNDRYSQASEGMFADPKKDLKKLQYEIESHQRSAPKAENKAELRKIRAYWETELEKHENGTTSKFSDPPEVIQARIDKINQRIKADTPAARKAATAEWKAQLEAHKAEAAKLERQIELASAGQNVVPVHLKMDNPYVHDFKDQGYRDTSYSDIMKLAKERGHDSVIFKNTYDPADPENLVLQDIHAVFEPHQIRSKFAEHDPAKKGKSGISFAEGGAVGSDIPYDQLIPASQPAAMAAPDLAPSPIDQQSSDVNMVNPEGALVSIPQEQLQEALQMGYTQAADHQVQAHFTQQKYGSAGQQAITGLEGLASGVAGSTIATGLERAVGVNPEDIRAREAANPGTHLAGEVAGFAGSALAGTGEAALLGKAGEAAVAATGLAKATGGWQSRVAADAVKGAFENALYQADQELGRVVKEDPEAGAGMAIAHIGLAGVAGGVFGGAIGAGLRKLGVHPDFPGAVPDEHLVSSADQAAYEAGDLKTHIAVDPTIPETKKAGFMEAFKLNKLKANAKEISAAREVLGAPETPGMLLESPLIQMQLDSLAHSPYTYSGNKIRGQLDLSYNAATGALEAATQSANGLSKEELGQTVRASLTKRIEDAYAPVKAAFEGVSSLHPDVPVSLDAIGSFKAGLKDIKELKLGPTTDEGKLARQVVSALQNAKTAEDISTVRNMGALKRSGVGADPLGHIKGVLRDRLQDLQDSAVAKYAKSFPRNDEAGAMMGSLIEQNKAAQQAYKPYIQEVQELSTWLGKGKIHGTQDALNFMNERLSATDISQRLFSATKDPEFLRFFSRKFPNEFAQVRDYQRMAIRDAAKIGEDFNPKKFFKEVDKLAPEVQKALYTADELKKIAAAETFIGHAFPKSFNPSGTAHALALKAAYDSPKGLLLANARDLAMEQVIKAASPKVSQAQALAEATIKGDKLTAKAVKSIFSPDKSALPAAIVPLAAHREKLAKIISGYQADPSKMVAQNDNNPLPSYAQAFSATTARAVQLLSQAKPNTVPNSPLDSKRVLTEGEKTQYNRTLDIAQQPLSVLARIKNNTLTNSDVITLKTLYPTVYNGLSQRLMNEVIETAHKGKTIPYATRMQLSVFLGRPLDSTMTQPFMAAAQAKPLAEQESSQGGVGDAPRANTQGKKSLDKLSVQAQSPGQARIRDRSDGKL